ncbi:HNH endonuclease [Vibrio fluvialis]|nr:HNH endonuclease [Vibrio fluvialis]
MTASGKPYLEVHHLIRLIDDGPDTPVNCVAVCPNCHRELHYSSEQSALTEKLKEIVLENNKRLVAACYFLFLFKGAYRS